MSGLTGYLLADGVTDLSNVFLSKVSGVALSGNNIFTGNNTFNNNITLPTSGVVPTTGQLGWSYFDSVVPASLASSVFKVVATSPTLPVGTYLFNGSAQFICTTGGNTNGIGAGFSDVSGAFSASGFQLATSTNFSLSTQSFLSNISRNSYNGSCIVSVITPTVYYYLAYFIRNATVAFNVGGQASFTRIA
jgi:hypothetical protein